MGVVLKVAPEKHNRDAWQCAQGKNKLYSAPWEESQGRPNPSFTCKCICLADIGVPTTITDGLILIGVSQPSSTNQIQPSRALLIWTTSSLHSRLRTRSSGVLEGFQQTRLGMRATHMETWVLVKISALVVGLWMTSLRFSRPRNTVRIYNCIRIFAY